MKRLLYLFAIAVAFTQCHDQNTANGDSAHLSTNVGGPIGVETANRWVNRYRKNNSGQREQSFIISKENLSTMVANGSPADGLVFHHALEGDKPHVVVLPYTTGQALWSVSKVLDANTDSYVETNLARSWAENYINSNNTGIRSHFFGSNVMGQILAWDKLSHIEIVPAVDDNGNPQLVLFAWVTPPNGSGRVQAEVIEAYDHSSPCPPFCPTNY